MTKTEIIAELRRSAREDADPWYDMHALAFWGVVRDFDVMKCGGQSIEVERLFFLILACALEDE